MILLIAAIFLFGRPTPPPDINHNAFLQAIALKEDSHGVTGKRGERGDYQMLPANVVRHGGSDRAAAERMLLDVIRHLKSNEVAVNPFTCALAWNAGWPKVVMGCAPVQSYRYAREVESYYDTIILAKSTRLVVK